MGEKKSFINVILLAHELGITEDTVKERYPKTEGSKVMTSEVVHRYATGKPSRLLQRMVLSGEYNQKELKQVVEHIMVCIYAIKYELDYELSFKENEIQKFYYAYPVKAKEEAE